MGTFDTLVVRCRNCDELLEFQSKADDCFMRNYTLSDVPPKIAVDLAGEVQDCSNCGFRHKIALVVKPVIECRLATYLDDEEDEDYEEENPIKHDLSLYLSQRGSSLEEFEEEVRRQGNEISYPPDASVHLIINCQLNWKLSSQGYQYWHDIYEKVIE